jgi:hypothetical protein
MLCSSSGCDEDQGMVLGKVRYQLLHRPRQARPEPHDGIHRRRARPHRARPPDLLRRSSRLIVRASEAHPAPGQESLPRVAPQARPRSHQTRRRSSRSIASSSRPTGAEISTSRADPEVTDLRAPLGRPRRARTIAQRTRTPGAGISGARSRGRGAHRDGLHSGVRGGRRRTWPTYTRSAGRRSRRNVLMPRLSHLRGLQVDPQDRTCKSGVPSSAARAHSAGNARSDHVSNRRNRPCTNARCRRRTQRTGLVGSDSGAFRTRRHSYTSCIPGLPENPSPDRAGTASRRTPRRSQAGSMLSPSRWHAWRMRFPIACSDPHTRHLVSLPEGNIPREARSRSLGTFVQCS